MLKIINKILFQKYDEELKSQILDRNLKVSKILLPIMVLISLVHIIIFSYNLNDHSGKELYWLQSLILAHTFLGIVALIFAIYQFLATKYLFQLKSTLNTISHLIFIVGFASTITFAMIDQMVTDAITPYLISLVFIPLIVILDFKISFIYILVAHIIFLIFYSHFQSNPDTVLSKSVNSTTAAVLSLIIAYINWSKNVTEYHYKKKIVEQQDELNQRNQELQKYNKNLSDINSEKDKFFSILAHDLRNPIGNFKILIDELLNYYGLMDEEERKEIIHQIKISSINTHNLLEDLLEWAKSQMSSSSFNKAEYDLIELINACIRLNETNLKNKAISLNFNITTQPLFINFDYNLLKSAILNLLSNAIKFSNPAGTIEISIIQTKNDVLVSIKDYGIGMNQEQIDNLFILSKKKSQVGTKGEIGSGLGLILVKDIIEKHNGKIWINSEINNGSTFTFSLPLN